MKVKQFCHSVRITGQKMIKFNTFILEHTTESESLTANMVEQGTVGCTACNWEHPLVGYGLPPFVSTSYQPMLKLNITTF